MTFFEKRATCLKATIRNHRSLKWQTGNLLRNAKCFQHTIFFKQYAPLLKACAVFRRTVHDLRKMSADVKEKEDGVDTSWTYL